MITEVLEEMSPCIQKNQCQKKLPLDCRDTQIIDRDRDALSPSSAFRERLSSKKIACDFGLLYAYLSEAKSRGSLPTVEKLLINLSRALYP